METPIERARSKLKEIEESEKIAKAHRIKYTKRNMTYAQVLQEPENILRLERREIEQQQTFDTLIHRHHPNLIPQIKDLFIEYWIDFLKGKVSSINEFLQEDKLDPKRKLKNRFNNPQPTQ